MLDWHEDGALRLGPSSPTYQRMILRFSSPFEAETGTVEGILLKSYDALLKTDFPFWSSEAKRWNEIESSIFSNPDTIGKCSFLSWLEDKAIGFFSYDPRQEPSVCAIGQNCILPEYQGKGFGRMQIQEILTLCAERKVEKTVVTTCDHLFFLPAQTMYTACGFRETGRRKWDRDSRWNLIDFEKETTDSRVAKDLNFVVS